ncbi:Lex2B [Vibrio alfacsensis]|uniref:glycosyltransferase family 25 protein n=1 Tax=Vibrio alfacsensis TaxID=1074311 RepID=UPI001BEF3BE6|nr:glycosyltransferase family 25 protein [Vibrio alfacsensis]BBM65876.1 Lex2B [Vibrio alfacsensis]
MKTFILSLKKSIERRERICAILNAANVEFEFFDALSPQDLTDAQREQVKPAKTYRLKGYQLTEGEVACFFSHMAIWQWCVKHQQDVLVLEDNVDIHPEIASLVTVLKDADTKFTPRALVKLAASKRSIPFKTVEAMTETFALGDYVSPTTGAMGYLIRPETASQLVHHAKEILFPVDDYMEKVWIHDIDIMSIFPDVVFRAAIPSTIGHTRKCKAKLGLTNKLYIEAFRFYEQLRRKLHLLTKHHSN